MSRLFSIVSETFLLLRRDRVFMPALVFMFLLIYLSSIIGFFSIESFEKLIYDMLGAGFHLTGAVIAILWGSKIISDSKSDGSIELQAASPVDRTLWVLGKYLGLATALVFIALTLVVASQIMVLQNYMGWMDFKILSVFGLLTIEWLVLAALATLLSSIGGQMTAMFVSFCAWIAGLVMQNIFLSLPASTPDSTRFIFSKLSYIWNLQRLNLTDYFSQKTFITNIELAQRFTYGISLIVIFVCLASVFVRKKDLTG